MEIWFRIGVARNLVPVVITFFRSDQRNHFFSDRSCHSIKPPLRPLSLSSFRKNKGIKPVASAIFPLTAVISRWFRNNTISAGKLVRVFISWPS